VNAILRKLADGLHWRDRSVVTIPPMDGAFRPNTLLDSAQVLVHVDAPDNLIIDAGRILFSSGHSVLTLPEATGERSVAPVSVVQFDHQIACLAARPGGGFAAGLENGRIVLADCLGQEIPSAGMTLAELVCPVAMSFADANTLYVCAGSRQNPPSEWKRDLMQRNASGSIWRIDVTDSRTCRLACDLAFPFGVILIETGSILVSESWRHRLITIAADGTQSPRPVLANLPGYPARLAAASGGGFWLSIFAPRNRLTEFVLRESRYRIDMLRDVDPEHWVGPRLATGRSFLEPLQCGSVRSMGMLKPWSPSASYGLIVRLDSRYRPVQSFHSRAGGLHHGTTSCLEAAGRLIVTSKGGNSILSIKLPLAAPA
jgi:hypothetical protein